MGRIADFLRNYLIPGGASSQSQSTLDVRAATKAAYLSGLSYGQMWLSGFDAYARPYVYSDDPEGWIQAVRFNVWASNCVDAREKGVASVGLKVCKLPRSEHDEPEKVDHPVVDLIDHANTKLLKTETSYKGSGERQLSIFGDWYTHKVRGANGKPAELFILPAHRVELLREDWRGYVVAYRYAGVIYPLEDVIRIYYPSDRDPVEARSPTSTAINTINRYNLADVAQEYIDRRGGRGGGILSFDASFLNTDIDKFMSQWDAVASDPRNAGRDAALPPGATYATGVLTAMQQQREERNRRLMKEIFAAYHVPPAKAGDYTDASVLANADQQDKHFATHFQVPELDLIAEMLTVDLLWQDWPETKEQGLYIAPCYEDIPALNKDEKLRAEIEAMKVDRVLNLLQGGAYSLNEAREELGRDKVSDPRADDVMLILGGESESEEEQKSDERLAERLNTSSLSTIRQVAQAFGKGEMDEQQARRMLLMAKPDMTDEEMSDLLIQPVLELEAESTKMDEAEDEDEPVDISPALEVLSAWSEDVISDDAASVLLSLALPDATQEEIADLLTKPEPHEQVEDVDAEDVDVLSDDPDDEAIDAETQSLLDEVEAATSVAVKAIDKDGDGLVYDNTPRERPATPEEKQASDVMRNKRARMLDAARKRQPNKKGKGRKPKKSEAQKEREREEKKAKRDAERIVTLEKESEQLRDALVALEGKDDPSNLRKRISQHLERIAARIESIRSGNSAVTSKLLNEAKATKSALQAMPVLDFVGMTAVDDDGNVLGVIEKIYRFGVHDGIKATKAEPVVIVTGRAYHSSQIKVIYG